MVLRRGQGQRVRAIGDGEKADLLAGQIFLDHQLGPGIAESLIQHQHIDRGESLVEGHGDHDTLAGGKTIRPDHDRRAATANFGLCRFRVGDAQIAPGRDVHARAEVLGETFRAFERGCGLGGAETFDAMGLQMIDEPGHQGRFRADDDEIDALRLA